MDADGRGWVRGKGEGGLVVVRKLSVEFTKFKQLSQLIIWMALSLWHLK
jgi:hypothetical protein